MWFKELCESRRTAWRKAQPHFLLTAGASVGYAENVRRNLRWGASRNVETGHVFIFRTKASEKEDKAMNPGRVPLELPMFRGSVGQCWLEYGFCGSGAPFTLWWGVVLLVK